MRYSLFGPLLFLALTGTGFATASPPAHAIPAKEASTPAPSITPKQAWIATMQEQLPPRLCDPKQYFVRCYKVTESECLALSTKLVAGCLDNAIIGLPEKFTPEDSELWSKMVGRCSFDLYEKYMQSQKRDLPECHKIVSKPKTKSKSTKGK